MMDKQLHRKLNDIQVLALNPSTKDETLRELVFHLIDAMELQDRVINDQKAVIALYQEVIDDD